MIMDNNSPKAQMLMVRQVIHMLHGIERSTFVNHSHISVKL